MVRYAAEGDFVVVTNNATDFRRLYATQPLHAGLVVIIPSVDRTQQQSGFSAARWTSWPSSGSRSTACWRWISRAMR